MRKRFLYNDILIIAVICVIVVLFFNSCKVKKEILETHIESRDSVCNITKSQNIILEHEDSVSTVDRLDFVRVDTGKVCIVKFNDIETRDTNGVVTHDKSITVYKKQNAEHATIDHIASTCSTSTDSAHIESDSVATTEHHADSIDQNDQKSDKGWNTYHSLLFWLVVLLLMCIGIAESERKK